MKRNKTDARAARSRPRGKYAEKKRADRMLYGPGCCANYDPNKARRRG